MDHIDAIIKYQEHRIQKAKDLMKELELIKDLVNHSGDTMKANISKSPKGNYVLTIYTDKLTSELEDTLDFNVVQDSSIRTAGNGVAVEMELRFEPMTVAQSIKEPVTSDSR